MANMKGPPKPGAHGEPLLLDFRGNITDNDDSLVVNLGAGILDQDAFDYAQHIGRRLVLCVNALDGMNPEAVKLMRLVCVKAIDILEPPGPDLPVLPPSRPACEALYALAMSALARGGAKAEAGVVNEQETSDG